MHPIQTPRPASVTEATAPPPLPLPGSTGGREDLPAQHPSAQQPSAEQASPGAGCSSALGSPLRTYLVTMAFLTVLWAVSGGGHFWPVWPMLGWGMGLVLSGQVPLGRPRRPTS